LEEEILQLVANFLDYDEKGNITDEAKLIQHLKSNNIDDQNIADTIGIIKRVQKQDVEPFIERERKRYERNQRSSTVYAINEVINYMKDYLNLYVDEQTNFLQEFTINPSKDIEIKDNKIFFKGNMKSNAQVKDGDTPINLSYDMNTKWLSINTLTKQEGKAISTNNTTPNMPLFRLTTIEDLPPNTKFKDKPHQDKTEAFHKELIALNIEKNKTLKYVLTNFNLE
jgi:hypothetical protein